MLSNLSAPSFEQTGTVCGECHKLLAKLLAYTTLCVNTNGPRRVQHRRWSADPGAWGGVMFARSIIHDCPPAPRRVVSWHTRDSADMEFAPTENGEMTSADIRVHIL